MDFLLELAWKNAAVAGVLALAAAGAGRLLRRPALAHGLWLLVLLKLVTPPLWQVPVPWLAHTATEPNLGPVLENREQGLEQNYAAAMAAVAAIASVDAKGAKAPPVSAPETAFAETVSPTQSPPLPEADSLAMLAESSLPSPSVVRVTWQQAIVGTWALGSSAWLGLLLVRLRRFRQLAAMAIPAGEAESRRVAELAAGIGLKRPPALRLLAARVPPMTWGFGSGHELLVPADLWNSLTPKQKDALVLHELAHLRRGDHWVRHFELLVFVLHWWHPVSWWARHELQEAEEECCDAWVVRAFPDSAGDYADLIVETVAYLSQHPSPALPPLASGLGQIQHVRKRLAAILKGPSAPRLSLLGWLGLAIVGCFWLPLIPTSAKESNSGAANVVSPLDSANGATSENPGSNDIGKAARAEEFLAEPGIEPAEERLALLRLQLVQKQAELTEEQALLDLAAKKTQRGTALASAGAESLEVLEHSLSDQKVHEARVRGREAGVKELQLRVQREEDRLRMNRETAELLSSGAAVSLESNGVASPEKGKPPSSTERSSVQDRLERVEKKLDRLFAEAKALEAELKQVRNREK